jgi:DNA-binding beta-propeller fold protein YncE
MERMLPANHVVIMKNILRSVVALVLVCGSVGCAGAYRRPKFDPLTNPRALGGPEAQEVVLVGNNWDGTVTVFDPKSLQPLALIDVVPDWNEIIAEIKGDIGRRAAFTAIRQFVGEGHNQLVDDVFTSPDGRFLYASRPSFADVVAIDVATGKRAWRTRVEGNRADHAALSRDGTRLLVSASTAKKVHVIDTARGEIKAHFESGDEPHESIFSRDESKIYHASIGHVFLPLTTRVADFLKGDRIFQIVDAKTFQVLERFSMRDKTKESGEEWIHAAVRPMTLAPDDRFLFFQMSFFHGFFEYDLEKKAITRRATLPIPDKVKKIPERDYQLNSAHHGITISGDGEKICVAGTMSGYAAIVDRRDFTRQTVIEVGEKPYWATTSALGDRCYVSVSERNSVAVISFADGKLVDTVPVGKHPQRVRTGKLTVAALVK